MDERGEVPASEYLLDDLREFGGLVGPDLDFLEKRISSCKDPELEDTFRRAMLDLLRNCLRLNIPLSQRVLDLVAGELERLWWPEAEEAEKHRVRLVGVKHKRAIVELIEDIYRLNGVPRPRSKAWDDMARAWGHASGKALRKDTQPSRVNRRPRRKSRG